MCIKLKISGSIPSYKTRAHKELNIGWKCSNRQFSKCSRIDNFQPIQIKLWRGTNSDLGLYENKIWKVKLNCFIPNSPAQSAWHLRIYLKSTLFKCSRINNFQLIEIKLWRGTTSNLVYACIKFESSSSIASDQTRLHKVLGIWKKVKNWQFSKCSRIDNFQPIEMKP